MEDTRAWFRKYRPSDLSDYIGEDIRHLVENRFTKKENRPQVIMVQGERGCGKTTFARLISKYYLCESPVDGHPCGECSACVEINTKLINGEAGVEIFGVKEVDATVVNGKDAIQEVMEDALMAPIYTEKKIIIFDEVHMVTQQAQSSLLKLIEDIPPFLVCIFATTNPEKVLNTIHSRCNLTIEVRKKTVDEMAERLKFIAEKEGLITSMEALKIIAKKADRVPRNSINLLEDIAKTYANQVTVDTVRKKTGDIDGQLYIGFYEAAHDSLDSILNYNKQLKEKEVAYDKFISGLTRFTLDSLYIRHGISMEDFPKEYMLKISKLFEFYGANEFDTLLELLSDASKFISQDDSRNELMITTTALKIGKLNILANGLSGESLNAERENKKSIKEYKELIQKEEDGKIDKVMTVGTTKEALVSLLNMTEVKQKATKPVEIELDAEATEVVEKESEFMSPEELLKMLGED